MQRLSRQVIHLMTWVSSFWSQSSCSSAQSVPSIAFATGTLIFAVEEHNDDLMSIDITKSSTVISLKWTSHGDENVPNHEGMELGAPNFPYALEQRVKAGAKFSLHFFACASQARIASSPPHPCSVFVVCLPVRSVPSSARDRWFIICKKNNGHLFRYFSSGAFGLPQGGTCKTSLNIHQERLANQTGDGKAYFSVGSGDQHLDSDDGSVRPVSSLWRCFCPRLRSRG